MIGLYLLAAHLIGDFVLQTRWQAARKLVDRGLRLQHVFCYSLPFLPIALFVHGRWWWSGPAFYALLGVLHYLTDSRRYPSTFGDWVGWQTMAPDARQREWGAASAVDRIGVQNMDVLPPNPWTPIGMMVDQALHVAQLAVLGGIFLT